MLSDYKIVESSQRTTDEDFEKYVERFVELNTLDNKKVLDKFITTILDKFDFSLKIVSKRDAVKFLLYQEGYPDIMELIRVMVSKHADFYQKERAKEVI